MNEVNKVIDLYNVCVGAVVALLSALFGAYWYLFASYLLTNVFDCLTGWYKSRKLKKESSKVGLKGIIKKSRLLGNYRSSLFNFRCVYSDG